MVQRMNCTTFPVVQSLIQLWINLKKAAKYRIELSLLNGHHDESIVFVKEWEKLFQKRQKIVFFAVFKTHRFEES